MSPLTLWMPLTISIAAKATAIATRSGSDQATLSIPMLAFSEMVQTSCYCPVFQACNSNVHRSGLKGRFGS
ncbi:hypothetical protein SPRG_05412 [Saprolegnia parasitica CBS 223.65]|uniref:Secreted protein n=1 Tax=Saprolegnia parasitica (strain CBS 223.65) TaxID=695850 RepID=A0A067CFC4_SAPPC|nr:hypothetical protein SPRG_05412 [Saprolegnia parasitica CBS 223.65]KDO29168.1 hypothetical protein SPRG_05412 [Saprolegnia parasitica CBS 223.65]|eukprot:XP_012200047.1 hypothetical protein SPRG_05412 [Saprolegnia parasitica CBS 223.65]